MMSPETGIAYGVSSRSCNGRAPTIRACLVRARVRYPASLTRALHAAGVLVVEVNRPDRATRRRGKSDTIDAEAG